MATISVKSKRQAPSFNAVTASNTYITQINTSTNSVVVNGNIVVQTRTIRSIPTVTSVNRMGTIVLTSPDPITPNTTQYWYMS